MAVISKTTFANAFSWMECFQFRFEFHRNVFLKVYLAISQHWFRKWLGAEQAKNQYLNQCWACSPMHICDSRVIWVNFERNMFIVSQFKQTCIMMFLLTANGVIKLLSDFKVIQRMLEKLAQVHNCLKLLNIMNHLCPNSNGGWGEPPLKIGHDGWRMIIYTGDWWNGNKLKDTH